METAISETEQGWNKALGNTSKHYAKTGSLSSETACQVTAKCFIKFKYKNKHQDLSKGWSSGTRQQVHVLLHKSFSYTYILQFWPKNVTSFINNLLIKSFAPGRSLQVKNKALKCFQSIYRTMMQKGRNSFSTTEIVHH